MTAVFIGYAKLGLDCLLTVLSVLSARGKWAITWELCWRYRELLMWVKVKLTTTTDWVSLANYLGCSISVYSIFELIELCKLSVHFGQYFQSLANLRNAKLFTRRENMNLRTEHLNTFNPEAIYHKRKAFCQIINDNKKTPGISIVQSLNTPFFPPPRE